MPRPASRAARGADSPRPAEAAVPVVWRDRAGSTQDEVRALLAGGLRAPLAVATTEQSAGRGRLGRSWSSPLGQGLALSVAHPTALEPAARTWLPLVAGLAVVEVLECLRREALARRPGAPDADEAGRDDAGPGDAGCEDAGPLGLKWPNDVHDARGRKLAGILAEATADGAVILGVGLNLAGPVRTDDGEVMPGACALSEVLGMGPEEARGMGSALAAELARGIVGQLRRLEAAHGDAVASGQAEHYGETCITVSRRVRVTGAGSRPAVQGTAVGIDDRGRLIVRDDAGATHRLDIGDVEHVRAADDDAARGLASGQDD
ncbi:biotin--[acetyl-CoA-carboxylase] ligase [Brachybacterium nesterenkovii]|uniref:biotin--[biotin carboxyl-carrier protein] ligase n=1 Tax=Brachybacterium nesterenkovii TaxID=47847 RepID=A0A1X6WYI1_9MICO|nr:biotin--[acetyl-CoA-carboxylase] ligase [Brachybacterium nesterenkovii]SLM90823.1 Biotin-protein ligase [Brachybacterium nesterenkovii]